MARRGRPPKGPKSLWDRVNEIDPDFAGSINGMTDEALREKLVTMANEDNKIEQAREVDTDLKSLREQLKTAGETYSVPLKSNKLRRRLTLQTLKERGKLADPE